MAGGEGGGGQAEVCLQGGVEFLKGSERPEAGCLGEYGYEQPLIGPLIQTVTGWGQYPRFR